MEFRTLGEGVGQEEENVFHCNRIGGVMAVSTVKCEGSVEESLGEPYMLIMEKLENLD